MIYRDSISGLGVFSIGASDYSERQEMEMPPVLDAGECALVDRYAELIRDLLPAVRCMSPALSRDEQVMEAARLAECRLAVRPHFPGSARRRRSAVLTPNGASLPGSVRS